MDVSESEVSNAALPQTILVFTQLNLKMASYTTIMWKPAARSITHHGKRIDYT